MLIVLFGYPGVGKNFVGEILRDDFNFFFYDGDSDLSPEIKKVIHDNKIVGDDLRDDYFNYILKKLKKLDKEHIKLVFAQALTKEKYRLLIKEHFTKAIFIMVETPIGIIKKRLKNRKHLITEEYARKVLSYYEKPKIDHQCITNDGDKEKIKIQLHKILNIT